MKEIELSQDKVALVDDEDFEYLNQWKWSAKQDRNKDVFYAHRVDYSSVKNKHISMHRLIMNTPSDLLCDHRDHNGLNNQKYNLRNCTRTQNGQNRLANRYSSSVYKGVSFREDSTKSWRVGIMVNKKMVWLGSYSTQNEAAKVYNAAATKHFGEFAFLNAIQDTEPIPPIRENWLYELMKECA